MRPTRVASFWVAFGFACAATLPATPYTVTTVADSGAGSPDGGVSGEDVLAAVPVIRGK